jgi:hypothetical protein
MAYAEDATCAIRPEDKHWRHFHQGGDHPGKFLDAETARWGCNVTPEDAERINGTGRLIDMTDVREAIRKRLEKSEA